MPLFFGLKQGKVPFWRPEKILSIFLKSLRPTWRSRTGWRGCRRPRTTSRSEIVNFVLSLLETWFWLLNPCFGPWEIIWNHLQFHSLKSSLASYNPSTLFLTFRWVWDLWKWFQMISHGPKHGLRSPNQVSDQNLQFHSLMSSLASYSTSTPFLTFRWVWDFLKWFQMIAHAQKPGVSSMFLEASL